MSIYKKIIAILTLSILIVFDSLAAAVSDNDGAAFISKAEFDSLRNTFQAQINKYNSDIDNKITTAISAYISGVIQEKTSKLNTGFVLDGDENKKIIFVGKTNDYNNVSNELRAQDIITNFFAGTFATSAYYIQDSYDTFVFDASWSKGNTNNFVFVLDKDNRVTDSKKNAALNITRIYLCYCTLHNQKGMVWKAIDQTLDLPSALSNTSNAYINTTNAQKWGFQNNPVSNASPPSDLYPLGPLTNKQWATNGSPTGITGLNATNYYVAWYNDEQATLVDLIKSCDVSIIGTDTKPNMHWPTGSNYSIKSFDKDHPWNKIASIKKYSNTRVDYTYTYKNRAVSGWCASNGQSFTPTVSGFGADFNVVSKSFSSVYYAGVSKEWGKNVSYAGGLPICHASKKSKVKITLNSDTTVPMAFTTSQDTTFPSGSDSRFRRFRSKRLTDTTYTTRTAPVNFSAGVTYDFEVDLNANEDLFLIVNMTSLSNTLTIQQIGDAYITEEG